MAGIEFHLVEIFRVFTIQHQFLAVLIMEEISLVRNVLAFPHPARVIEVNARVAAGTCVAGKLEIGIRRIFHWVLLQKQCALEGPEGG